MADIRTPILPAEEYNQATQEGLETTMPSITAEEVYLELEKRCDNGMQYTTFANTITDEQKAILETQGYIVTRNVVPSDARYGEGDLYIGFQVALNEEAAKKAMQISPDGANIVKYLAANISMSMDSSTFVLTTQLYNIDGDPIGDEQQIDLPIEVTVVDGYYDSENKALVLILKSGTEISIPVSDLINGLQEEITSDNPLDADLVDDTNSTHKFVTEQDITNWNGKQDALTFDDVPTDNSNNPVKSNGVYDALATKQDTIDANHKLDSDLIDDTNQTNKFVTTGEKQTWDGKQDALTFDDSPTEDSNNPVTSDGIYDALEERYPKTWDVELTQAAYDALGDEKLTDNKNYYITDAAPTVIYGFHVSGNESDSDDMITYLEDAVGMTPGQMGATDFDYGSWRDAFFMPKPCMVKYDATVDYYLDPSDFTKKEDGVTASDVADTSYPGNVMIEWPKIWYKIVPGTSAGDWSFYCSNTQVDNTYNCYCNYDCDGNEIDHFYTRAYNGCILNGVMRSISGLALTSANGNGNTSGSAEVTAATANNIRTGKVEWYTSVLSDRELITCLLMLVIKSTDCKSKVGNGLITGGQRAKESYVTGTLNDKGLFWGDTSGLSAGVKVFGMENFWGGVWERTAGCVLSSSEPNILCKLTYSTVDGSTGIGYNSTGAGYIDTGVARFNKNSWLYRTTGTQWGFFPSAVGSPATETSYYKAYNYQTSGSRYLLVGGSSGSESSCSVFYWNLNNDFGNSFWYIASGLSLKPLVVASE